MTSLECAPRLGFGPFGSTASSEATAFSTNGGIQIEVICAGREPETPDITGRISKSPRPLISFAELTGGASLVPHSSQYREASRFSVPQDWHRIIILIL